MDFNFIGTIWSLLPPVVAIGLALKTKEVYSSLFIGIVLGAILYSMSMGTGLEGFLTHLLNDTVGTGTDAKHYGLISCLSDPWNVGIIVFLVVLGSIVSLMNKAGGSAAFGRWASKHIKTKIGAQIATIILGLLIFIDDYFNCLTVGSVMRPITVRHGVTKEKLAYLIDSTAAPVCIISPISSWAAAVSGFVSGGENGLALFCQAIPFNFYAFFTIIFIFMIVLSGFDFKAMSKYDARLQEWYERTGGQVDEVIDTKLQIVEHGVGAKQDSNKPASTNGSVAPCSAYSYAHRVLHGWHGLLGRLFRRNKHLLPQLRGCVCSKQRFCRTGYRIACSVDSHHSDVRSTPHTEVRQCHELSYQRLRSNGSCHTDSHPCMDTEEYDRLSWRCRIRIGRCGKHCLWTADAAAGNHIHRCSIARLCHRHLLGNVRHTHPYLHRRIPCCSTAPHHLHLSLHGRCSLRRPCVSDFRHHYHGIGRRRMQARSPCIFAVAIRPDSSHRVVSDIRRSRFHTATRHHSLCCHFLGFRHSNAFLSIMGAEKNQ